jgi:hypothetical protein
LFIVVHFGDPGGERQDTITGDGEDQTGGSVSRETIRLREGSCHNQTDHCEQKEDGDEESHASSE